MSRGLFSKAQRDFATANNRVLLALVIDAKTIKAKHIRTWSDIGCVDEDLAIETIAFIAQIHEKQGKRRASRKTSQKS
jgi:hypothetical protein